MTNTTRNFSGLLLLAVALMFNIPTYASDLPCTVGTPSSVTIGNPASPSFDCGGLLFDNFAVTAADGVGNAGIVSINSADYETATMDVNIQIDPSLLSGQDDWLMYEVTGGVKTLDLAVGGYDAEVDELACSAAIPTSGPSAYLCPKGSFLGQVADFSGDPADPVFSLPFPTTTPVYVFKDISVGGLKDAQLSDVDQSFLEPCAVPEPMTMLLMAGGLLGIGLFRRKRSI